MLLLWIPFLFEIKGVSNQGHHTSFECHMMNKCFIPCNTVLQKLLSMIGIVCQMQDRKSPYDKLCDHLWCCFGTQHAHFFCHPVGYGNCQLKMSVFSDKGICMTLTLSSVVDVPSQPCCCLSSSILPLSMPLHHICIFSAITHTAYFNILRCFQ
jgi:hypothetical protein